MYTAFSSLDALRVTVGRSRRRLRMIAVLIAVRSLRLTAEIVIRPVGAARGVRSGERLAEEEGLQHRQSVEQAQGSVVARIAGILAIDSDSRVYREEVPEETD